MKGTVHLLQEFMARIAPAVIALLTLATCAVSPSLARPGTPGGVGALKSLEIGINAYKEGAIEVAVESLSDALQQGHLSETKIAQALYYRGLAYRELCEAVAVRLMHYIPVAYGL